MTSKLLLSLPRLGDVEIDYNLEAEAGCYDGGPSHDVHHKMVVYDDHTTWKYLVPKKDLHPLSLKWFLLFLRV